MKKVLKTLLLLLTVNVSIMAQEKQKKGFEVSREIVISVSADDLWNLIGSEFENAHVWASSVDHSVGKGKSEFEGATCSERYCDINAKGFNKISEKLINYSNEDMNLAYQVIEGMPSFITKAVNDWTVVEIDEGHSKLVMKAEFGLKGLMGSLMKGMMKRKMENLLDVVLNDAKVYLMTGEPSENKQDRMRRLAKQDKIAA